MVSYFDKFSQENEWYAVLGMPPGQTISESIVGKKSFTEGNTWNETRGMKFIRLGPACSYDLNLILTWRKLGVSTSRQMLGVRQEGRGQGTTIKRMMQPLRKTGYHKNQLEPTRSKMVEALTSSKSWASSYVHCNTLLLFSLQVMSDSSRPHGLQHARHPCPSLSPGVCPSSCPLTQWCHPTISSFVTLNTFSSVQSLSCVWLFVTPWIITACQASLPFTNSWNLLQLMSIKAVMSFSHLIFCRPLLLLPPFPPSIRVFSSKSTLRMRWPKYWSFSFSISPSNEHPGLISFRMDWLDLLAVQETLKSLLQHHSSKASVFQCSAFFTVQPWHPYMATGKTIALTFTMLSRWVITFLARSKRMLNNTHRQHDSSKTNHKWQKCEWLFQFKESPPLLSDS